MMVRRQLLWIVCLAAVLTGACDIDEGPVFGRFSWDASVTGMTLTGLNVPVENALPDPNTLYELKLGEATILWQASGAALSLDLAIKPNPAIKTEIMMIDFRVQGGASKNLLFEFFGDQLTVLELVESYTGVAF